MPLTPFHLGPALLLWGVAGRRLDPPSLLIGSVIVDVRAALVLFGPLDPPVHGPLTTLLGGAVVALLLSAAAAGAYAVLERELAGRGLPWDWSPRTVLAGSLAGVWSHVLLDATLYGDVRPFAPLEPNPFLGIASSPVVYGFCVVAGVVGLAVVGLRVAGTDLPWRRSVQ